MGKDLEEWPFKTTFISLVGKIKQKFVQKSHNYSIYEGQSAKNLSRVFERLVLHHHYQNLIDTFGNNP